MNIKSLCLVGTLFVSVGIASDFDAEHLQIAQENNASNASIDNSHQAPHFAPNQINHPMNAGNNASDLQQQNNPDMNIYQMSNVQNVQLDNILPFNAPQEPLIGQNQINRVNQPLGAGNNGQNEPQQNNPNLNNIGQNSNMRHGNHPQFNEYFQILAKSDENNTPQGQQDDNFKRTPSSQMNIQPEDTQQRSSRSVNITFSLRAPVGMSDNIPFPIPGHGNMLFPGGIPGGDMLPFFMPFMGGMPGNVIPFPVPFPGGMPGNVFPFPVPFPGGMPGNVFPFPAPFPDGTSHNPAP